MNFLHFRAALILIFVISVSGLLFAAPEEVVEPYGTEFVLNGQPYRFVGMNIRGICHYGQDDILPYTDQGHIDVNLDGIVDMGGKVIRLFAPCKFASHQENADRLENVLDKMEARGLKAIVCLTDIYNSGFCPQGDGSYYETQSSGWMLLDDAWFNSGYEDNYKPYVELVVNQLRNHNAIFAWEIGNELTDLKDPGAILPFTADIAATIKSIDPWHMVTTGYLAVEHTQVGEEGGYQMYSDPNIDFITEHSYDGDDHHENHSVHSRLRTPLVLEEYGWTDGNGDRVANTQYQIDKWFTDRAARGFMNWGYQAQSYDIGDGDSIFGIDRYHHDDYNEMVAIFENKATELENNPPELPDRLEPRGVNIATSSVGWNADSVFSDDYGGDKVYDGVISSGAKWTSDGSAPPHWVAIDLGRKSFVDGLMLYFSGINGELIDYNPKAFQIQTGSSLSGPWTTVLDVENPAQFSYEPCLFDDLTEMQYLRVYVTDTGIDNYCRLPEIEVYEVMTNAENWTLYR